MTASHALSHLSYSPIGLPKKRRNDNPAFRGLSSGKPGGDPGDAVDFTRWRGLSAGAAGEPARQWADRNVCPTLNTRSVGFGPIASLADLNG